MKNQEPRTFGQKTLTQCKFWPIMFEVYPTGVYCLPAQGLDFIIDSTQKFF